MQLTQANIKKIKHSQRSSNIEKIRDISNLYLQINTRDKKSWLYRYSFNKKQKSLGLGAFPQINLTEARQIAQKYNQVKATGIDPANYLITRKIKHNKSLNILIDEYLEKKSSKVREPTLCLIRKYLSNDIQPYFKGKIIDEIQLFEIVNLLDKFSTTPSKQKKIKSILSGIYKLATIKGLCKQNIMLNDFTEVISTNKSSHYAFINPITQQGDFSILLYKLANTKLSLRYSVALQLLPLLAFRPSMLCQLKWEYFNQSNKCLVIPANVMKMKQEFKQPLSKQAYDLIMYIKPYTANNNYIFSDHKDNHISPDRLREIVQHELGFNGVTMLKQTIHGFRHSVSTGLYHLQGEHKWQSEAIELILDHRKRDKIQSIYNKYEYIEERREILQVWANYLDKLRSRIKKLNTQSNTQLKKKRLKAMYSKGLSMVTDRFIKISIKSKCLCIKGLRLNMGCL
ncbi:tyrosine-type recombinase/integrase [Francisella sp. SYW-9]|uniref:tyrosine-type recombinase/integrase n=1 Tax=Francisella sp. SYW-9 TaxID=2610888 RepID=UPI00123E1A0C|nr:site-specific integrase [Francisella sp. SYW-9]